MRFFSNVSITNFSNSYLIGPDQGEEAVLIDPGIFNVDLLNLIEDHKFYIRDVLITHAHNAHIQGIKTLLKIYEATIHSLNPTILEVPTRQIHIGEQLKLRDCLIEVLETPGHSSDSVCFRLGRLLFTGDTLTAGMIGTTASGYERALLLTSIREKLLSLDDNTFVFPGHGPPTKIGIERKCNPYLKVNL